MGYLWVLWEFKMAGLMSNLMRETHNALCPLWAHGLKLKEEIQVRVL